MKSPGIPAAADLAADGREAARRRVPLLLAVTRIECGYCAILKREILIPMVIAGDHPERVLIRELNLDSTEPLTGFDGRPASCWSVASGYEALFSPTVLLVGPDGTELADRIVGLNTPEMYGWYLDRAIEAATRTLAASA
jgi:thioredoxin-related protein